MCIIVSNIKLTVKISLVGSFLEKQYFQYNHFLSAFTILPRDSSENNEYIFLFHCFEMGHALPDKGTHVVYSISMFQLSFCKPPLVIFKFSLPSLYHLSCFSLSLQTCIHIKRGGLVIGVQTSLTLLGLSCALCLGRGAC